MSERHSKLELRIGKRVIAETPSANIDEMVSLVEDFREIRCDDTMWEPVDDKLPGFDAFAETLKTRPFAIADKNGEYFFDIFESCTVWNVLPNGDSVKVTTVWNRGY